MSGVFGDKGYITREVHPLLEATKPRHRVTSRAQRLKLSWHRKAPSPGGSQKAGLSQCASLFVVAISVGLRAVAPAGASGAFVLTASQPRRAGAAGSWRLPSSAPPAAAAAAVAVAASGKSFFFTHSSWSPSTLCLDQCSAAAPAATAAMRMSTPASQFGKSGEMPQDDGGYWSDTSQLATQAELVELSNFHLDACGTAESSILSGDPDIDDVNEGGHRATVTPGVRGKKEPHHKLSGTWLPGGLPRSVHIVWKRMLTKQDWLHLHASSSLVYQIGGSLWLLHVMALELFWDVPQLEVDTPVPLFILGAGLASSLSSIPMANTRSWVLNGVFPSIMQLWFAWYVSGAYPPYLWPADPWLAAGWLALLVIAYVETEQTIAEGAKARELARLVQGPARKVFGQVLMREGDYVQGDSVNRYGALSTLVLNAPHLFATLFGSGWVERLAEAYPAAPALLFHAYFALATSTSITLLAPTLYMRRLIDANTFLLMQFVAVAPMVTSVVDASVFGAAATNNPFELYLGYLH